MTATWKRSTVRPLVRGKDRSETEMPCTMIADGTLAVHKRWNKTRGWEVTHVLSGLSATNGLRFKRKADAQRYALDLHAIDPAAWGRESPMTSGIARRWRNELQPKYEACAR